MAPIDQSGPFGAQKCCFWPETIFLWTALQRSQHKNVVFLVSGHDGNKKSWTISKTNGFLAKKLHFLPKMTLFGPKSAVSWPEINFLCTSSNVFFTIMTGHQKDNILGKWNCIVLNVIAMFMAKCTLMPI